MHHMINVVVPEHGIPRALMSVVGNNDEIKMVFVFGMTIENLLAFGSGADRADYSMTGGDELMEYRGCDKAVCACEESFGSHVG